MLLCWDAGEMWFNLKMSAELHRERSTARILNMLDHHSRPEPDLELISSLPLFIYSKQYEVLILDKKDKNSHQ